MQAKKYLEKYIKENKPYNLTKEDKKIIQFEGIGEYIYRKLYSSKFRESKIDKAYNETLKESIKYCVENKIPLTVNYGFGAAKNPHTINAPHIDWAEVFNVFYLREYLKPIAAAYEPGIELEYFSVAMFQELVNFIPREDTDIYEREFKALVAFANDYFPKDIRVKYATLEETHNRKEIMEFIKKDAEKRKKVWEEQEVKTIELKLLKAERNAKISKDDTDFEEKRLYSALAHDSFGPEEWAKTPVKWNSPNVVCLGNNNTAGWAIRVKSAPGSVVNFWTGTGMLEERNGKFIPRILSAKQFRNIDKPQKTVEFDIFDGELELLNKIILIEN